MRILNKSIFIVLVTLIALPVSAQETKMNHRMEFIICKLKDGKTLDDVVAYSKVYGEEVKAKGLKYNQYLMRPMIAGERLGENTHVIVGSWPNGKAMYDEYGNYMNSFIENDDRESPSTCSITVATLNTFLIYEFVENESEDKRFPVQMTDCKLKDGISREYAMDVEKQIGDKIAAAGFDGWGVQWAEPYLGFEDFEYDYISIASWQSFEHRADIANNYHKVAEEVDQLSSSVSECKNSRAYVAELLFQTWER